MTDPTLEQFFVVIVIMWGIFLTGAIVIFMIEIGNGISQAYGSVVDDYCNTEDGILEYCLLDNKIYSCVDDMSKCKSIQFWTTYNSTFPTIVKNVEWCTSSDSAFCKIDGYIVDCEEHVQMCLDAAKLLPSSDLQDIESEYIDENGTRTCLGKFCREMVDRFQDDYYKYGGQG